MKFIIFDFNRTLFDPEKGRLITGAKFVLDKLNKENKLVLITRKEGQREDLIKSLGIEKFFAKVIITEDKNESDFLNCCKDLGVKPEQVIVVGDRIKGEIVMGNKLKMTTIHFKNGLFAKELPENKLEEPTRTIKTLKHLLKVLRELK